MSDFDEVDLAEVPEELLDTEAGAGSGAYKTLGCCWCLPWYSSWTRCGESVRLFVCGGLGL